MIKALLTYVVDSTSVLTGEFLWEQFLYSFNKKAKHFTHSNKSFTVPRDTTQITNETVTFSSEYSRKFILIEEGHGLRVLIFMYVGQ